MLKSKTALHLLVNEDINLSEAISSGEFTSSEQQLISQGSVTIISAKSNVKLDKINIMRDMIDLGKGTVFIYPVGFQSMLLEIENMDANMTGTIFNTIDPMNAYFNNINMDMASLTNGFYFLTQCNYPEADLTVDVTFNNITIYTSYERTLFSTPHVVHYLGPGNFTANNCDFRDHYSTMADQKATIHISTEASCQPNDGLVQKFDFHNASYSLENNPNSLSRFNSLALYTNVNPYRKKVSTITGHNFVNYENDAGPCFIIFGTPPDEVYYLNNYHYNHSYPVSRRLLFGYMETAVIENAHFELGTDITEVASLELEENYFSNLKNITFIDWNATGTTNNGFVTCHGYSFSEITLTQIKVVNCHSNTMSIFKNIFPMQTVVISDGYFESVYFDEDLSIIQTGEVESFTLTNHTFVDIKENASGNVGILIQVNAINLDSALNSSISDISVSNSQATLLSFDSVRNSLSTPKMISIENVNYTDSDFTTSRNLIEISGIELEQDIFFILNNFRFERISYKSKGNLLYLGHKLSQQVVLNNFVFSDLTSTKLLVEAFNKQDLTLKSRVKITNSSFNNINGRYHSFLNVLEGGDLEVENCTFGNFMTYEEGAVLFASSKGTVAKFTSSVFENNTAENGAVFFIENEAFVD